MLLDLRKRVAQPPVWSGKQLRIRVRATGDERVRVRGRIRMRAASRLCHERDAIRVRGRDKKLPMDPCA